MKSYKELSIAELKELQGELNKEYEEAKAKGLKLNMARGLPSAEQLDMEADFFNTLSPESDFKSEAGIDCRNYGELVGIHEARELDVYKRQALFPVLLQWHGASAGQ